jgi:hypothetical protein
MSRVGLNTALSTNPKAPEPDLISSASNLLTQIDKTVSEGSRPSEKSPASAQSDTSMSRVVNSMIFAAMKSFLDSTNAGEAQMKKAQDAAKGIMSDGDRLEEEESNDLNS